MKGQANEHSVHQPLEGRPRIPQTKRHADELKQSEGGDDGSLGDVVGKHLDLIVPLHKVEGGEHVGAGHVIRKISNVWNGVLVWNRSIVETPKNPHRGAKNRLVSAPYAGRTPMANCSAGQCQPSPSSRTQP